MALFTPPRGVDGGTIRSASPTLMEEPMEPMTVGALRRALAELPDDATVIDAASGHALVDVDTDPTTGQVTLMHLDTTPARRRRSVVNTVTGHVGGTLIQTGGDYYGDIRL